MSPQVGDRPALPVRPGPGFGHRLALGSAEPGNLGEPSGPAGRLPRITNGQVTPIKTMAAHAKKVTRIARTMGLSRTTVYRLLKNG